MGDAVYTIDVGNKTDIEAIAAFQVAMALETENYKLDPATVLKGVTHMFEEPERGFYLVVRADDGRAVAGLLILKEWSDWRNTDVWWIHSVYVAPEHRRNGLFRRMFAHIKELAARQSVAALRLYVEKANVNAKATYTALGMSDRHYDLFEGSMDGSGTL